jgi:hypothetical protein
MRTLEAFGATKVDFMFETEWEEDEEAELQAMLEGGESRHYKDMGSHISIRTIPQIILPSRGYFVSVGETPLGVEIFNAATSNIPNEVSNDVAPMGPSICIRRHPLDAGDMYEEYSGRISLSIMLSGWSRPRDFDLFRDLYFQLEVIRKLDADLRAIWGELERIMYTES